MDLFGQNLTNHYDNGPGYFYFANAANTETFDPSATVRVQAMPTGAASIQGSITANSTLSLFSSSNHSLRLAEWTVSLDPNLAGYPLALHVNSVVYSAGNITNSGVYYLTLATDAPPPPPPPPPPPAGDVILLGDSITQQGGTFLNDLFPGKNVVNAGSSGATTGYTLSRIESGEFDSYSVAAVVLMIGTNDVPTSTGAAIGQGVQDCVEALMEKMPGATIHLMSITHRFDFAFAGADANEKIDAANVILAGMDGGDVNYLNLNADAGFADGSYTTDGIHLGSAGYTRWHDMLAGDPPNPPTVPTTMNVTFTIAGSPVTVAVPVGQNHTIPFTVRLEA